MNRRFVLLPLILLMLLGISACSANSSSTGSAPKEKGKITSPEKDASDNKDFTYKIIDETYSEDGIKLVYPQLTNARDAAKADTINKAIQRDIRLYLENLKSAAAESGKLSLDLEYKMTGYPGKTISIAYTGLSNISGALYPVHVYHTQNIDLENCDYLPLNTVFKTDGFFIERLKAGMYAPYSDDLDLEAEGVDIQDQLDQLYSDEDLIKFLNNENTNYLLTDQGVIVSVEVPHVLGDHLEMAINYESIESNMIKDNPIWKDYPFIVK